MLEMAFIRGIPLARAIFKNSVQFRYVPGPSFHQWNMPKNVTHTTNLLVRNVHRNSNNCFRKTQLCGRVEWILLRTRVHPLNNKGQHVRKFHTTAQKNAIPPVIWLFVKPVAKLASVLTGRTLRKMLQAAPKAEKFNIKQNIRNYLGSAIAFVCTLAMIDYVRHLQETVITHRKRYLALTSEQLNEIISFELKTHFKDMAENVLPPNDGYYILVRNVAKRIIDANQDLDFFREQKWTVIVVNDASENAYVLPTGHIFVHKGLLNIMSGEDELAAVLGHEMSHALLQHSAERLSFLQFIDQIVIITMVALWFVMPSDGIAVITHWFYEKFIDLVFHLPYSRKLEVEADIVGLQLIAKACYDVRAPSAFWSKMLVLSCAENSTKEIPQWLSTHPGHEKRANTLNSLIPEALTIMKKCNCPPLPKEDPRKAPLDMKKVLETGDYALLVDRYDDGTVKVRLKDKQAG